ncbi:Nitric oxide-associated protein 1, partial [Orchesella cincta]
GCRSYSRSKVFRSTVNNLNVKEEERNLNNENREIDLHTSPVKKDLSWMDKVIYSSYLEKFMPPEGFRKELAQRYERREAERKAMVAKSAIYPTNLCQEGGQPVIQFPYKILRKTEFINDEESQQQEDEEGQSVSDQELQQDSVEDERRKKIKSFGERLKMRSIDLEEALENPPSVADMFDAAVEVVADIGTPDPHVAPSSVPCGGCGAHLHCQDPSIPGYISSEKFKNARKLDLMGEICHRCCILESHQATLNVNVSPEDYPKIVGGIQEKFAMALLMVDLTDFPCSIWPGILDIIGTVDQFFANIMHTALISAKTGYGVEDLISRIFNSWKSRGDIFIMGCTNVGKSSLFNMFLQSDLCKPQAADLVQRATISQWPGTTLNLLKFPLTSPYGWRGGLRYQRLIAGKPVLKAEENERQIKLQKTGDAEHAVLTGYVGRTFVSEQKLNAMESAVTLKDPFRVNPLSKTAPPSHRLGQWDPDNHIFTNGHWVYDTPGAVNTNQILDILTLPELMKSLPKTLIKPRTFFIKPGISFFVAGLARVDFVEGDKPIRFTIFSNSELPVAMVFTTDADEVYKKAIGTNVLGIPCGGADRLEGFPELKSKEVSFEGKGQNCSCGDVVLSSIGWIAVTVGHGQNVKLLVHTPDGKGIFVRTPALLPNAVNWKGKRIRGTYSYLPHKQYMPKNRFGG